MPEDAEGKQELPKPVAESLEPGETVVGVVRQKRIALEKPKWLIVTTRKLVVLDEKLLGRYELTVIPYEKLRRVYHRAGIVGSEFQLELEEGGVVRLDWMDKRAARRAIELIRKALEMVAVEPPVIVKRKHLVSEEWILEKPRELIARTDIHRAIATAAPGASEEVRVIEELEKLKKLLDEGAITREEYEALKQRLLQRLAGGEASKPQ